MKGNVLFITISQDRRKVCSIISQKLSVILEQENSTSVEDAAEVVVSLPVFPGTDSGTEVGTVESTFEEADESYACE